MNPESDFYIGYLPKAPMGVRGFVRWVIVGLGLLAVILAVVLSLGQMPFAEAYFEFSKLRDFEGTIVARPYPSLLVSRPGQPDQGDSTSEYLLVAPGKHGADSLISSFVDKNVRLRGQLIYRDGETMIEIDPGSLQQRGTQSAGQAVTESLGTLTVTGEIVDSKCYLGVMNPGSGKVHRDCASRCLSGGIPPLFVEFLSGKTFLLVGADGSALSYNEIKTFIAEPLTIHGEHLQTGEQHLLRIDLSQLQHSD
jgi:hypothetical protein